MLGCVQSRLVKFRAGRRDTTLSMRKPEVHVHIDRDRASDLGIPVQVVANSLNVLVGGQIVSRYKEGTEQYDVWLRADQKYRANPQSLETLTIPSGVAGPVQLTSLAKLTEARGPSQIERFSRQRTVTLLANPEGFPNDRYRGSARELNCRLSMK